VNLRFEGLGQWIGSVEVPRGQRVALREGPRMTLAYVGMTAPGPGGEAPEGEEDLSEALSTLRSYNVLRLGAGLAEDLLARKQPVVADDLPGEYLSAVAKGTGADLILAARPAEGGFERRCEVLLYPARPSLRPLRDRLPISLEEKDRSGDLKGLLRKLEATSTLAVPWIGLRAIDTHGAANPVVVRVPPGGPAASAGVKAGETIVSLGGKAIGSSRDIEVAVSSMKEGTQASLSLQAPGEAPRQVNVVIESTPVMVQPFETGRLQSRIATELYFRAGMEAALGRAAGAERTAALLSLGSLLMSAGLQDAALEEALLKVEAPEGAGLSAGTAAYLKGVAFWQINKLIEARQQLTYAASQGDATVWRNDGPPVAERARRTLSVLPPT
jgi:hypothetical protein